ncbi:hypothetical protein QFC22_001897 [Naganishia vaughanmartiniae]|uniref:Uncharacterized protein n=1 Tax=Naganishia vaughanmartiniae TaxID=1424756 RepID=A0ACC2XHF1_9TREE|nr:hypothetical protein QFC22_001897 [Naganishia vaughanmartiniae]
MPFSMDSLNDNREDAADFWKQALKANDEARKRLQYLSKQILNMHERDIDSSVRLHNSYVLIAEAENEHGRLKQELARLQIRHSKMNETLVADIARISTEREIVLGVVAELKRQVKELKEQDPETVEGMWARFAKPIRIEQKELRGEKDQGGSKRKLADTDPRDQGTPR